MDCLGRQQPIRREFDPEALARLLESADSAIEVRLEVQGISLVVTNRGVWVTDDPPSSRPSVLDVDAT